MKKLRTAKKIRRIMGCILSRFTHTEAQASIEYCIPSTVDFRPPHGKIIISLGKTCNAPVAETYFFGCHETSVRLWRKVPAHPSYRFLIEKPCFSNRSISNSTEENEVGIDTVY